MEVDWRPDRFKMLETEQTRRMIETRWAEATKQNSRLYNASKYRLAACSLHEGKLVLRVGLTDYKDHVGTNLSPTAGQYVMEDMEDMEDKYSHMSQCVGVGCWVLTTDRHLVMVENAAWKGEQAGAQYNVIVFRVNKNKKNVSKNISIFFLIVF